MPVPWSTSNGPRALAPKTPQGSIPRTLAGPTARAKHLIGRSVNVMSAKSAQFVVDGCEDIAMGEALDLAPNTKVGTGSADGYPRWHAKADVEVIGNRQESGELLLNV